MKGRQQCNAYVYILKGGIKFLIERNSGCHVFLHVMLSQRLPLHNGLLLINEIQKLEVYCILKFQINVWNLKEKIWCRRKRGFAIGRVVYIHPGCGDFYLRQILMKVRGAVSYVDLRTINGFLCRTYQAACQHLGLLSNDDEWLLVIKEVSQWGMCSLLRYLFVTMLMFCELSDPLSLFNKTWELLSDDITYQCQRDVNFNNHLIPAELPKK
ncbi:unnamed protein product [Linum trigynum]|uniref:Uncharacterized protein n=1 Tax=Linum trigynum TaxID=586398 RepID=A0AAV2ED06_9ROSI